MIQARAKTFIYVWGLFLGLILECLLTVCTAALGHCLLLTLEALWPEVGKRIEETDLMNVSAVNLRKRICILLPRRINKFFFKFGKFTFFLKKIEV